jgi:transposase
LPTDASALERALRGIALGRKAWLFAGSERGGERAAIMYTLIQTAKLNDVDPQVWLGDVRAKIADHPITGLAALLPWNWKSQGTLRCMPPLPPNPAAPAGWLLISKNQP